MSLRTQRKGKNRTVNITTFVALGILGILLVIFSGLRTYDAQQENSKVQKELKSSLADANGKLSQSLMAQEFMKGQLGSIGTLMTKVSEKSTDPVLGQMANAISKLAGTSSTSKEKSEEVIHISDRKIDSALIYSGRGMLTTMMITPNPSRQCAVQVYDGLDKTGVPIGEPMTTEQGNSATFGGNSFRIPFSRGLYIGMVGCTSYTIGYTTRKD